MLFKVLLLCSVITVGVFCLETTESPNKELSMMEAVTMFQKLLQSSDAIKEIALMINQLDKESSGITLDEITEQVEQFHNAIAGNGKDGRKAIENIIERFGELTKEYRK